MSEIWGILLPLQIGRPKPPIFNNFAM